MLLGGALLAPTKKYLGQKWFFNGILRRNFLFCVEVNSREKRRQKPFLCL